MSIKYYVNNMVSYIKKIYYFYHYKKASLRNFYPYRLVGERPPNKDNDAIIIYTMLGKRDIFEILLKDLSKDKNIINKFPPHEAHRLGILAMCDIFSKENGSSLLKKIESVRNNIIDKID